jgi:hypothetical protein
MTEREMLDLLNQRYSQTVGNGPRWARAEHVRDRLGFDARRTADYIAMQLWPGVPHGKDLALHGHEIKCSRGDWLAELKDPDKAEAFRPYMHYWWLVVSDPAIVKPGELPPTWGLMVVCKTGGLRIKHRAPWHQPQDMPLTMWGSLLRATGKTAARLAVQA